MFGSKSRLVVLGMALFWVAGGSAQQAPSAGTSSHRSVRMNVVVTTASGQSVTDLQEKDFTVYDNRSTRTITSFKAVGMSPKPQEAAPALKFASERAGAEADDQWDLFQYEITFDAPCAERANEYHQVGVKVDKANLIVRAPQGYFAQADDICRT